MKSNPRYRRLKAAEVIKKVIKESARVKRQYHRVPFRRHNSLKRVDTKEIKWLCT